MRLRDFFSLQTPLMVHDKAGDPVVVLAFGLGSGLLGGRPVALCIGISGGRTWWAPIASLTFPSPIQVRPEPLKGPARANHERTVKAVLQ